MSDLNKALSIGNHPSIMNDYLKTCENSILSQNIEKEVILADSKSTNGSGEICDKLILPNERVKVIHKPNCDGDTAPNVTFILSAICSESQSCKNTDKGNV